MPIKPNQMVVTVLPNGAYDVTFAQFDWHIRPENGGYAMDCFYSGIENSDKAHVQSFNVDGIGEALAYILTGEH